MSSDGYTYPTHSHASTWPTHLLSCAALALFSVLFAPAGLAQIADDPAANEYFGQAVAAGDFDDDGYLDAAIGVPGENGASGAVHVLYGSPNRLTDSGNQFLYASLLGGELSADDQFGLALETGDFNGDGFDDLAIGVPLDDVGGLVDAGSVYVVYGSANGLRPDRRQFLVQTGQSGNEAGDLFGRTLAAGDFNGDNRDDLAIGIPSEDIDCPCPGAGAVSVRYGTSTGLGGDQVWHQGIVNTGNPPETFDAFGFALAAGDFDGNGFDDLVIGLPGEDYNSPAATDAGMLTVLYGSSGGLAVDRTRRIDWSQDFVAPNSAEDGDQFGRTLAAGDFDGDGHDDVAVGVPFEDNEGQGRSDTGIIAVFYGSTSGISNRTQAFDQNTFPTGSIGPLPDEQFGSALAVGDFGGDGFDDLAIGTPQDMSRGNRVGMVYALYGSSSELQARVNQIWDLGYLQRELADEDRFGSALAAGDFNGDGRSDLLVGVPNEDPLGVTNAGSANVIYSDATALTAGGNQYLYQNGMVNPTAGETGPDEGRRGLHVSGPNPARATTSVEVTLAETGPVRLSVYDLLGQEIAVLLDGTLARGVHESALDATRLAPGVYVLRLVTGETVWAEPLTIVH